MFESQIVITQFSCTQPQMKMAKIVSKGKHFSLVFLRHLHELFVHFHRKYTVKFNAGTMLWKSSLTQFILAQLHQTFDHIT